jgi:hypothetical protein
MRTMRTGALRHDPAGGGEAPVLLYTGHSDRIGAANL